MSYRQYYILNIHFSNVKNPCEIQFQCIFHCYDDIERYKGAFYHPNFRRNRGSKDILSSILRRSNQTTKLSTPMKSLTGMDSIHLEKDPNDCDFRSCNERTKLSKNKVRISKSEKIGKFPISKTKTKRKNAKSKTSRKKNCSVKTSKLKRETITRKPAVDQLGLGRIDTFGALETSHSFDSDWSPLINNIHNEKYEENEEIEDLTRSLSETSYRHLDFQIDNIPIKKSIKETSRSNLSTSKGQLERPIIQIEEDIFDIDNDVQNAPQVYHDNLETESIQEISQESKYFRRNDGFDSRGASPSGGSNWAISFYHSIYFDDSSNTFRRVDKTDDNSSVGTSVLYCDEEFPY